MPAITSIRFRRGTAAQWASVNPVLAAGEMGLETDTRRFKFGNGTQQWNAIAYASAVGTKGEGFIISETAPTTPDIGDVWYCNDATGDLAGKSFIRYDGYWVEINPGLIGPQGIQGIQGPTGATGATGPTGPQGIQGATGATGAAATIAAGSTITGAPGTNASVTNSGTSSAAIFEFTIPRGATGATGPQGDTGAPGAAATVAVGTTTTGAAGSSASVTNSGTSSAATLNFTIPRGDTGAAGAAATIAVGTVTTGAAGSSATVTNVGTSSAATFNFSIPRGDTGATGPQGATGATGATGAQGPSGVVSVTAPITNTGTSTSAVIGINQAGLTLAQSQITGLTTALDGKANTVHTHNMGQIVTTVTDRASAYTIVAADENTFIRSTSATAVTMTIANVLAIGESVQFIQFGAGQITLAAGAGVALRSVDNKLKTNKQYSVVAVTCVASGEYLVTGDVVA